MYNGGPGSSRKHCIGYFPAKRCLCAVVRNCERFPHIQFPHIQSTQCVRCLRDTYFNFLYFSFLIIQKDLREILLIFALEQYSSLPFNKKNKQKETILWNESNIFDSTSDFPVKTCLCTLGQFYTINFLSSVAMFSLKYSYNIE